MFCFRPKIVVAGPSRPAAMRLSIRTFLVLCVLRRHCANPYVALYAARMCPLYSSRRFGKTAYTTHRPRDQLGAAYVAP